MASRLRVNVPPAVSGNESYWGGLTPDSDEVSLINQSPTLHHDLWDYGNGVNARTLQPMMAGKGNGTYFNGTQIVMGQDRQSADTNEKLGTLSHELGHFENQVNDKAFASQYAVNPRDPNAYNVDALKGAHAEGEAFLNNWQAQQEILKNTSPPGTPGTQINFEAPAGTQQLFDQQHAENVRLGTSSQQDNNSLIGLGMNASVNDNPSTAPNKSYYTYYGESSGTPAPESGTPPKVSFSVGSNGDVNSMQENWPSGDVGTQTFSNGKIQSGQMTNAGGQILSSNSYSYNPQGGYSVDTTDGAGNETRLGQFNEDGSGTVSNYAADRSSDITSFNAANRNTEQVDYDPNRQLIRDAHFNPDSGYSSNVINRSSEGNITVSNFDAEGRARAQFHYNANGNIERKDIFNEKGVNTDTVQFNADGSRQAVTFNGNGSQSGYFVNSAGQRSPYGSPASNAGSTLAPPQTGSSNGEAGTTSDGQQQRPANAPLVAPATQTKDNAAQGGSQVDPPSAKSSAQQDTTNGFDANVTSSSGDPASSDEDPDSAVQQNPPPSADTSD